MENLNETITQNNISVKDEDTLKYELGVLMYNAYNSNSSGEYDIQGNFSTIISALDVELNDLKDGFIHEALNYGIEEDKIDDMFDDAKNIIE